jgi:tRNA-2-methylthio-N6-dimethylallyladenosine synthase
VNSFGLDEYGDGTSFAELLERAADMPGLKRLRFTTSHPKDIAPEVVEAFARFDNLCPHLHLPLQSGSDKVLAAMGRGYDSARYLDIVRRLRRARPEISLTTDLIVGFPGETRADFEDTMRVVGEVGFESSFSFAYSDRPGTGASRMSDKIEKRVKLERLAELQSLQEELTRERLDASLGLETEVLVEGPSKKQRAGRTSWRGRDAFGRVVNFARPQPGIGAADETRGAEDLTGSLVKVRITAPKKHSLWGEAAGDL